MGLRHANSTRTRGARSAGLLVFALAVLYICAPSPVAAQIDAPGKHSHYVVELEPHFVWQWTNDEISVDDGIGLGFRASIPILQDGPVTTINNSLAITFGLDWAHFGGGCYGVAGGCSEDDVWVPVALQWNFYLTKVISVFPEFGLGFRDAIYDQTVCTNGRCRASDLSVYPVLWFGARFRLTDLLAIVVRLGTPSLQFGVSFFL
jgi:hypothetical protein